MAAVDDNNNNKNTSGTNNKKIRRKRKCSSDLLLVGIAVIAIELFVLNIGYSTQHHGDSFHATHPLLDDNSGGKSSEWSKTHPQTRVPDGMFNGYPVYYHEPTRVVTSRASFQLSNSYHSSVQCVGENYQPKDLAWMHRSCHYSLLCFDVEDHEFVVFQQPSQTPTPQEQQVLATMNERQSVFDVSQTFFRLGTRNMNSSISVALGGINPKWTMNDHGVPKLQWSPRIIETDHPPPFYTLPAHVVLVPFHSLSGENPGHLVWDDWLPIYTLLEMFHLLDNSTNNQNPGDQPNDNSNYHYNHGSTIMEPLLLRYVFQGGRGLWASCDWNMEKREACRAMHQKFLPLMTSNRQATISTTILAQLNTTLSSGNHYYQQDLSASSSSSSSLPKSSLVCARHGVAGLGALTDHGTVKLHGWELEDYKITHNHGRAGLFWKFRQHALRNLGVAQPQPPHQKQEKQLEDLHRPYKIIFSLSSSTRQNRNIDFHNEIEALQAIFRTKDEIDNNKDDANTMNVVVESYIFKDYSLKEQVEIANSASIMISGCGGGAVTAMFLPRGASLLLYYAADGGIRHNKRTYKPARLDWDYFNHLGYIKVHWLDRNTMQRPDDIKAFIELIQHDLNVIRQERRLA
jgi:hypothetical protein